MSFVLKKHRCHIVLLVVVFFAAQSVVFAQTFNAWLRAGDEAFNEARYAEAVEHYKKALGFETGDVALDYRMAEACRLYKDYEKAEAWYGKVFGNDKTNSYPLALFYLAEMKKYNADYGSACRLFGDYAAKHVQDSGYFAVKAKTESGYCEQVLALNKQPLKATVVNAGNEVNSKFSDFGASISGDSVMYYASLRFLYEPKEKKKKPYFVSRILKSEGGIKPKKKPAPIAAMVNDPPLHNGNAGFSPDHRLVIFTRCEDTQDGKRPCRLYYSKLNSGRWSKPELIIGAVNSDSGYTATQPSIEARGAEGYTLYFASDRPGGLGKMDIWKSDFDANMRFSEPVNLGAVINTFDDEMTPHMDTRHGSLYFSSYGHAGLGGMDIFKSKRENGTFSFPENIGKGYNTSQNDVYFTINSHDEKGTLTSNRTGSLFIASKTCCYDIYYHEPLKIDTLVVAVSDTPKVDSTLKADPINKEYYEDFLPLSLYFDNDEPDKRTLAVTTNKSYDKLYRDYISRIPEYKQNYADRKRDRTISDTEIDSFFTNTVTYAWNMLNGFCAKVEKAMKAGVVLELEIRGRASPLAETAYNVNLSRRRISSLQNYLRQYNNGALRSYFDSGKLKLTEVPAGESLSKSGVSDNRGDVRNSVYNPNAASERLIELIGVRINPKSNP